MRVTLTSEQLEIVAEWLHGTSTSTPNLEAPLGAAFEGVELEHLTADAQVALYNLVDRCADCGWWASVDELLSEDDGVHDDDSDYLICDGCRANTY